MYGAKVTIELINLGNTKEDAAINVNKFLDWCDEASSIQGFTYETTDYEIPTIRRRDQSCHGPNFPDLMT